MPLVRLPALHDVCDAAAVRGQRLYSRSAAARLWLGIAAAAFAAFAGRWKRGDIEVLGLLAAAAFLCAFVVELWMLVVRPERVWYEARAIAESSKSSTWRYAVGGSPHAIGVHAADDGYTAAVERLVDEAQQVGITGAHADDVPAPGVVELREAPFATRRATYLTERLLDQQRWYERKATLNAQRSARLKYAMLAGEALGVGLAVAKAVGAFSVDLSGIVATSIGAGAAWLAIRQHEVVARTYRAAGEELAEIASVLSEVDESAWGRAVQHAENALLREHAAWHTSRTDRAVHRFTDTTLSATTLNDTD